MKYRAKDTSLQSKLVTLACCSWEKREERCEANQHFFQSTGLKWLQNHIQIKVFLAPWFVKFDRCVKISAYWCTYKSVVIQLIISLSHIWPLRQKKNVELPWIQIVYRSLKLSNSWLIIQLKNYLTVTLKKPWYKGYRWCYRRVQLFLNL